MADNPTYLTPEGLVKLQDELDHLVNVRRPEIAAQIHAAKSEGDVSDSSGYEEAKNMQGFIEGRIITLQKLLRDAVVIEGPKHMDVVGLGSRVTVQEGNEEPEKYLMVGPAEADPISGRLSIESPLGKALVGARAGDSVVAHAPSGALHFRVLSVE